MAVAIVEGKGNFGVNLYIFIRLIKHNTQQKKYIKHKHTQDYYKNYLFNMKIVQEYTSKKKYDPK